MGNVTTSLSFVLELPNSDKSRNDMNFIKICTNKKLFEGGDSVFGAVYVKIETPTAATGILLRVLGNEYFHCRSLGQCEDEPNRVIQDRKEHTAEEDIIYQQQEPLSFGKYVIPFKICLPTGIPGSFHLVSASGPCWQGSVEYKLEAEFIGKCNDRISSQYQLDDPQQTLFVTETAKFEEGSTTVEQKLELKGGFKKSKLNIQACLNRPLYSEGDTMKLSIGFSNSGSFKPVISSISIKVLRDFKIDLREERFLGKPPPSPLLRAIRSLAWGGGMKDHNPNNLYVTLPHDNNIGEGIPRFLKPEHGPTILYETLLTGDSMNLMKGVTNLRIPLKSNRVGTSLPPTVRGHFLKSEYYVRLEINVNDNKKTLEVPIPHVRCNRHYVPSSEPSWVADGDCRLILSQHKFSVCPDTLTHHIVHITISS